MGNVGGWLRARLKRRKVKVISFDRKQKDSSLQEVIAKSGVVFLCLRPQNLTRLFKELDTNAIAGKVFITAAAAVPMQKYYRSLGKVPLVRIMPSLHGRSPLFFSVGEYASSQKAQVIKLLNTLGATEEIPEKEMDAYMYLVSSGAAVVEEFLAQYAEAVAAKGKLPKQKAAQMLFKALNIPQTDIAKIKTKAGITAAGIIAIRKNKKFFKEVVMAMAAQAAKIQKI